MVAAVLAMAGFYVADAWLMIERAQESASDLAVPLGLLAMWHLAVGLVLALVWTLGLAVWKLLGGMGTRPVRSRLVGALVFGAAASPLVWRFTSTLSLGENISRHEYIALIRIAAPVLISGAIAAAVFVGDRCVTRSFRGGVVGALLTLAVAVGTLSVALGAAWWDATQFRGQYAIVHDAAVIIAAVMATGGAAFILHRACWAGRRSGIVALLVALVGGAVTATRAPDTFERSIIRRQTIRGGRLLILRASLTGEAAATRARIDESFVEARARRAEQALAARRVLDSRMPDRRGWNLLWITVDTLRADRLGCYGYSRPTSPAIDALAARSALFERAWCQNPITHYSFQSMFFGRYPEATPLFLAKSGVPDPEAGCRTIARVLREAGYETASIPAIPPNAVGHPTYEVLTKDFEFVNPGRQGDDVSAKAQTPLGRRFLETRAERPWFLWLHYMDPHAPYVDHARWGFGRSESGRYDSEIRTVDSGIAQCLDVLARTGMDDRTIIVLNGDHGESLGDHGTDFHGSTLYEEQVRVPLIVHVPGLPPHRVRLPVENVDLKGTLLDLLQVPHSPDLLQGDSLVGALMEGDAWDDLPPPVSYSVIPLDLKGSLSPSATDKAALRVGDWKLVLHRARQESELYDLASDPGELRDVAHREPETVDRLRGMLEALEAETRDLAFAESGLDRLKRRLASADSSVARLGLLESAVRGETPGLDGFLTRYLADPELPASIKWGLLRHVGNRRVDGTDGLFASALASRSRWGDVASALEGLRSTIGTPHQDRITPHVSALSDLLDAPAPLARMAAELLAHLGDVRGEKILRAAVGSEDRVVAFRAWCALARLGQADACSKISKLESQPRLAIFRSLALSALAHARHDGALASIVDIARQPFLNHKVAMAAVRYLRALETDEVITPLLLFVQRWDPTVAGAARAVLSKRVGAARTAELVAVGKRIMESLARIEQGQGKDDVDVLLRACESLDAGGRGLIRLYASRACVGTARSIRIAKDVLRDPLARRWHDAARSLASSARDRLRLEVLELAVWRRAPVEEGTGVSLMVKLRNGGSRPLPGGRWPGGVKLQALWTNPSRRALPASNPIRYMPENGLMPGATTWVSIRTEAPRTVVPVMGLSLRASCTRESVKLLDQGRRLPIVQWSVQGYGLEPKDLVFRGEDLIRGWYRSPAIMTPTIEEDGSVALLATRPDPYIVSPGFLDTGRPVEVTLTYEAVVPDGREPVTLECYRAFEAGGPFTANLRSSISVPANARQDLVAPFPPRDGKGLRRIRIDIGQRADLFRIHEIRIRTL